jgi:hypothetical protein
MSYTDSLPASFALPANINFAATYDGSFTGAFGVDTTGQFSEALKNLEGFGALSTGGVGWTFITAPEDISWDLANQATRVDMFGTNNPPVVAGSRGMRDLTLGNALVEGFVRGKQVEAKIEALEKLMNYQLNPTEGFVTVPVYQVWANEKSYGGPEAYYIIKDIKVKETMRDLTGNATRAFVDISLMQVPKYQVNSGRDQASQATAGVKSALLDATDVKNAQQAANAQVDGNTKDKLGGPKGPQQAAKPAKGNEGTRGSSTGDTPGTFNRLNQETFETPPQGKKP